MMENIKWQFMVTFVLLVYFYETRCAYRTAPYYGQPRWQQTTYARRPIRTFNQLTEFSTPGYLHWSRGNGNPIPEPAHRLGTRNRRVMSNNPSQEYWNKQTRMQYAMPQSRQIPQQYRDNWQPQQYRDNWQPQQYRDNWQPQQYRDNWLARQGRFFRSGEDESQYQRNVYGRGKQWPQSKDNMKIGRKTSNELNGKRHEPERIRNPFPDNRFQRDQRTENRPIFPRSALKNKIGLYEPVQKTWTPEKPKKTVKWRTPLESFERQEPYWYH